MRFLNLFLVPFLCTVFEITISNAAFAQQAKMMKADEIVNTLSVLTGIDYKKDTSIFRTYQEVKFSLPQNSEISSFSPNFLLASLQLSSTFCQSAYDKEVNLDDLSRKIFKGVNLTQNVKELSFTNLKSMSDYITQSLDVAEVFDQSDYKSYQFIIQNSNPSTMSVKDGHVLFCTLLLSNPNTYLIF